MRNKETHITKDNVFADLELDDADEMVIRSDLMSEVVRILRESELPQKEIAFILDISAPKVSSLMSGKINDFSNDTLMHYLTLLGCNLEIRVHPQHPVSRAGMKGSMKVKRHPITRCKRTKSKA